jgi:hypothetical protein
MPNAAALSEAHQLARMLTNHSKKVHLVCPGPAFQNIQAFRSKQSHHHWHKAYNQSG